MARELERRGGRGGKGEVAIVCWRLEKWIDLNIPSEMTQETEPVEEQEKFNK